MGPKSGPKRIKNGAQNRPNFEGPSDPHFGPTWLRFGAQSWAKMAPSWGPKPTPNPKRQKVKKTAPAAGRARFFRFQGPNLGTKIAPKTAPGAMWERSTIFFRFFWF